MIVTKNGVTMNHFSGIDRFSDHVCAKVYGKANSNNVAKFLVELIENMEYQILVDRDSERVDVP